MYVCVLIESQESVPLIKVKYMTEEGIKVSARPILVLTCFNVQLSFDTLISCCIHLSYLLPIWKKGILTLVMERVWLQNDLSSYVKLPM